MRPLASALHAPWALALVLTPLVVACASCKGSHSSAGAHGDGAPASSSGALTPEQAAQVLARVGTHVITLGDFQAALEHMDQFDRMRYQSPERRKELLGEMIDVLLLADEARERGYDKDPVTQQEIREILRDALLRKAREGVPAPNDIPVEEVRAYYEAHRADFRDPERRRVSAVVLPNEAAANKEVDGARKADAVKWGELVRTRSVDPSAKANVPVDLAGDLGFVSPPGDARGANARVPDEVRAAVFGLEKVGDVGAKPVKAGGTWWIVKLSGKTDAHDRTYEEAERQIRVKLAQDKIRAREQALLDELRTQYPVQIDEGALAQVNVTLPSVDAGADAR
jgi:parvulin-like peptidyl-prolyl isomerase